MGEKQRAPRGPRETGASWPAGALRGTGKEQGAPIHEKHSKRRVGARLPGRVRLPASVRSEAGWAEGGIGSGRADQGQPFTAFQLGDLSVWLGGWLVAASQHLGPRQATNSGKSSPRCSSDPPGSDVWSGHL